jgi:alpha-tubulin suppressor-like RCC1 family protein
MVTQGASGTAAITIARTNFTGAVALSVSGAPTGVTASVAPASTTGNTAEVTLNVGDAVAPGTYTITVTGQGQGVEQKTVTLQLNVVAAVTSNWAQVSAGLNHTCGIAADGKAYCWGYNASGQLGTGDQTNRPRPVLVAGGHTWASVSVGANFTCGIATNGSAYCWGAGGFGQLGDGSTSSIQTTPVPVSVSGGDTWATISTGDYHVCAVTPDGRGYCWGGNGFGQLGNGNTQHQTTRVPVSGDRRWKTISAGGNNVGATHTCGVTTAGEAFCWGNNWYGQLGDGTVGTRNNPVPVPVVGGRTWSNVTAGSDHSCGVTTAGDAYCWGYNNYGQLGNGNRASQPTPTLVLNGHQWASVSAGFYTTCGLTTAGDAYCWGFNGYGQTGNGNTSEAQTAPARVAGGHTWIVVEPGHTHACGRTNTGVAYCWGRGDSGELGAGSTTQSLVPLRVSGPQ